MSRRTLGSVGLSIDTCANACSSWVRLDGNKLASLIRAPNRNGESGAIGGFMISDHYVFGRMNQLDALNPRYVQGCVDR
ncbi:hypothetical protein D3C87_2033800 [compost metagenome]